MLYTKFPAHSFWTNLIFPESLENYLSGKVNFPALRAILTVQGLYKANVSFPYPLNLAATCFYTSNDQNFFLHVKLIYINQNTPKHSLLFLLIVL